VFSREFDIEVIFGQILRRWYIVTICAVIGGLMGIGVAKLKPPLYEARATILSAVDWNRAISPDDITIYQADDRIRALLLADETLEAALALLDGANIGLIGMNDPAKLRQQIKITHNEASFDLYAYSSNAQAAPAIVNAWAHAGLEALNEAYLHAVKASELQKLLFEASCELEIQERNQIEQAVWFCVTSFGEQEVEDLPDALLEEARASRGILPIYSFSLGSEGGYPQGPILWARANFILGGLVAGFVLGFLIVLGIPERHESVP
jgi:hypothetical protein